jgi:LPXTG-motif cell wall-anchored protein
MSPTAKPSTSPSQSPNVIPTWRPTLTPTNKFPEIEDPPTVDRSAITEQDTGIGAAPAAAIAAGALSLVLAVVFLKRRKTEDTAASDRSAVDSGLDVASGSFD